MTEKKIIEGNKIIIESPFNSYEGSVGKSMSKGFYTEILKYHTSWDWLLPVYKKLATELRDMRDELTSYKGCTWVSKQATLKQYDDMDAHIRLGIWGVRIEEAYENIIHTIKWYNKNKNDTRRNAKK